MVRNMLLALVLALFMGGLNAIPLMTLEYGGGVQVTAEYEVRGLLESSGQMGYFKLLPADNGFTVNAWFVNLQAEISESSQIHVYQHPVPLPQDGGYPEFVLAQSFMGKIFILQKNSLHLFMTVIDDNLQAGTVVTNNPSLSFLPDPLAARTFCFLSPNLMLLSNQGGIYLLDLQAATCIYKTNFPASIGNISLDRLDGERVLISSYIYDGSEENTYLLNCQDWSKHMVYYDGWATRPISADFGGNLFLVTQRRSNFDWLDLVRTLLMDIDPDDSVNLYSLYYGGSTDAFNYTPMHTFEAVQMLGDNRFLAICTDYGMIPNNQRLGIFQVQGNSVVYDPTFTELHELDSPSRLYKIQDGYYLSYHNYVPYDQRARLLDMEAQAISLPDSNVIISPVSVYPTGQNSFFAVNSGDWVHVYRLVEPSSVTPDVQAPDAPLRLSVYPNPFRGQLGIELKDSAPGQAIVEVFDLRGRRVRSLTPAGDSAWTWDGRDDKGQRLASGVYVIRASSGGQSTVRKAVLLD